MPPPPKKKRTLDNSEVRPYSWPALLVFVSKWLDESDFGTGAGQVHPTNRLPQSVYMPDGSEVPICVIEAAPNLARPTATRAPTFPDQFVGGGYPVIVDVQGEQHLASIACLVTDGHLAYALTSRHVIGEVGTPLATRIAGTQVRIGESTALRETRRPFPEVYPGWSGRNVYVSLDVGLIRIDDVKRWTAQVFGIGQLGEVADLNQGTISLRLIGCPVKAFGAASGAMVGEVAALFYRFKAIGGFEYVADLLIGPRGEQSFATAPGGLGTLWVLDRDPAAGLPLPLAVQWGGQVFQSEAGGQSYALATFLSTVCTRLNVDLIREWNVGLPYYWGAIGHYSIANLACATVTNARLKR